MKKTSVALLIFSFALAIQALGQARLPLIKLDSIQLNDAFKSSLQKSLITEGPGLVLVVDSQSLTVAAFVSGEPERMEPSSYFLVDVFPSSNGVRGHETPQGIFKLLSSRMKEKDFSRTYGVPLNYTMFWQDLNTKSVSGVAFHAAAAGREKSIGVECASAGCVNLSGKKAESLFSEVVTKFSTEKKGSDVMVVSSNGSLGNGFQFRDWQRTFSEGDDYHERWNQLKEQNPEPALGPQKPGQKIKLVPTRDLESEKILIDSRRPIAGNGDTASSLFLVQNLIRRGYKGVVDILVDEKSERILRSLSKNLPGFASSIRIFHESELSSEPYSMVIRSGLPSGRVFDLGLNRLGTKDTGVAGKININDSTLFLSLTIYGNTENRASVQPLSLVVSDNKYYLMPATGLGVNRSEDTRLDLDADKNELSFQEGGIFRDPFSLAIRNWSLATTEKFLLKQTTEFNPQLGQLMAKVIEARKTEGVKYSLAYGFSIPQVKRQARDYFRSLLSQPTPTIVFTPSAFGESLLNSFSENEKNNIKLTSLKEFSESGGQLERGHLTVVQIPNVPHHVFASLLLASNRNRVVPLGAGDGFFTTALSLGIPFAPTIVEWNIRNVRALSRILQVEALRQKLDFSHMQNLRRVYSPIPSEPIDLARSQQILRYESLFRTAITQIPDLVDLLDSTVGFIRKDKALPESLRPVEASPKLVSVPESAKTEISVKKNANPYGGRMSCREVFK